MHAPSQPLRGGIRASHGNGLGFLNPKPTCHRYPVELFMPISSLRRHVFRHRRGWIATAGLLALACVSLLWFSPGTRRRILSHARRPSMEDLLDSSVQSKIASPLNSAIAAELVTVASFEGELQPSTAEPNTGSPTTAAASNTKADPLAWNRFRGPNGTGLCNDTNIPLVWSDTENIAWKTPLPGAGSSSPILTDRLVLVTSYSGYGGEERRGSMEGLQRHLTCIDRQTGAILWTRTKPAVLPDDPYQGMGVPEHGYATNTPVTDGERVVAFFGKSGVVAYDLQGNELWQTSVGTESGNRGWGTAASLVLYEDLVIVNAAEESQSMRALKLSTGELVWTAAASSLELAYGTPVIAEVDAQRDDLILAVPGEVWGMNPRTGKLAWYAQTSLTGNLSPSVILHKDVVYVFGGYRSSGSTAIRIGGTGDVTKTHVLWTSRNSSYVSTPVLCNGALYWIDDRGTFYATSAETGELLHRERVSGIESRDRPVYASPIAIGDKLYFQTRHDGVFVAAADPDWKPLHNNRLTADPSMFNATPAVGDGQLFLRSDTQLICIGPGSR